MQVCIQHILCLILIPDPSTSHAAEVRIGVKSNRRGRSRREITTQRILSLGPPRFVFPGNLAGARLQTIPLGPSRDIGLHLLTIPHLF